MWIPAAFLHAACALTLARAQDASVEPRVSCSVPFDPASGSGTGAEPHFVESEHFVASFYTEGPDSVFRADMPNDLLADLEIAYRVLTEDPRCRMHAPAGIYDAADG